MLPNTQADPKPCSGDQTAQGTSRLIRGSLFARDPGVVLHPQVAPCWSSAQALQAGVVTLSFPFSWLLSGMAYSLYEYTGPGLGLQFAALGAAVDGEASAKRVGREIPTDWF